MTTPPNPSPGAPSTPHASRIAYPLDPRHHLLHNSLDIPSFETTLEDPSAAPTPETVPARGWLVGKIPVARPAAQAPAPYQPQPSAPLVRKRDTHERDMDERARGQRAKRPRLREQTENGGEKVITPMDNMAEWGNGDWEEERHSEDDSEESEISVNWTDSEEEEDEEWNEEEGSGYEADGEKD